MSEQIEQPQPLTYIIGISYVGGEDYLNRALASIGEKHWPRVHVINSTEPFRLLQDTGKKWAAWQEGKPEVPLTHTQTHNLLQSMASGCDVLFIQHADAEAEPDTFDKMLEIIPTLPRTWGILHTAYDVIAAYNPKVWAKIGGWDWQNWPSYYSDNDYYYRMRLAGFSLHESNLPVKHVGSHVINRVDKWRKFRTAMNMEWWEKVYRLKWGGKPGEEIFTIPFNLPLGPYADD